MKFISAKLDSEDKVDQAKLIIIVQEYYMNTFSTNIRSSILLGIVTGTFLCSATELLDTGIKTAKLGAAVTGFAPTIPALIGDIRDGRLLIDQTITSLVPQIEMVTNIFSPGVANGLPELLTQAMSAYARKEYDKLGFSKIGVTLETAVPQLMRIILQTYPFIYFFTEKIGRPVIPLTATIGTIMENSFVTNFSNETMAIINSGTVQEAYNIFNELDTLLSYDLLPRMTDLFVEIDRILPQMAKIGILK